MNWLRAKLRKWLFPEFTEKIAGQKEIRSEITRIKSKLQRLEDGVMARVSMEVKEARDALSREGIYAINLVKYRHKEAMEDFRGETNSMFFMFPEKKRIAVKVVLRLLMDRLRLTVNMVKDEKGEPHPIIRKKKREVSNATQPGTSAADQ